MNPTTAAVLYAGIPTAVVSFLMMLWAIRKNYLLVDDDLDVLKKSKEEDDLSEDDNSSNDQESKYNPVHQKWLYFGGGYYGLMALVTYIYLEVLEVIEFIGNYESFNQLMDQITVKAIFGLVIESFLNIIPAFTWFIYWPKELDMTNGWYWLVASYIGYHIGSFAARKYAAIATEKYDN